MAQFTREFLSRNPKGWTPQELKEVLRAQPAFWRHFERNPNAYPDMIRRLLQRGDIENRAGLLFALEAIRLSVLARNELFEVNRG